MSFWDKITIPLNYEWREEGVEFVNPLDVADKFAESAGINSYLGQQAEDLTAKMAEIERKKTQIDREIYLLRRQLMARHYSRMTKSASSDIQDAFIIMVAEEDGVLDKLVALEERRSGLDDRIDKLQTSLEAIRFRMRVLEKNMDWAKQWLDFEKLLERLASGRV